MTVFRRNLLYVLVMLFTMTAFIACENPFDPLDTSDEIRGLSYVDYTLSWERWDSDPEFDGVEVAPEYFNEFNDSLSFRDKPHRVVIEFYTQQDIIVGQKPPAEEGGEPTDVTLPSFDQLFFAFPAVYSNSDDIIRVPIEAYRDAMVAAGYSLLEDASAFVLVRVFPPQQVPQRELVAFYDSQIIYKPEPTAVEGDDLTGENSPTVNPP